MQIRVQLCDCWFIRYFDEHLKSVDYQGPGRATEIGSPNLGQAAIKMLTICGSSRSKKTFYYPRLAFEIRRVLRAIPVEEPLKQEIVRI